MHYDDLIVGAGLYGAVFAHEMRAKGRNVLVIDGRDHIAGNAYTQDVRGIAVHRYGAHIFHTSDKEVRDYVSRFVTLNHYVNAPVARFHDELYNLPFNMNTFSRLFGVVTPAEAKDVLRQETRRAIREMIAAHTGKEEVCVTDEEIRAFTPDNLEEQGLSLAGRTLFDKLIRGYTEKQWGRDCKDLPAFILQRVPFRFVYDNNYFNDPYQGIPEEGYTALCERLLTRTDGMTHPGVIDVRTGVWYEDFVVRDETGLPAQPMRTVAGDTFDRLVYTGMIDVFFGSRFGALEYRSLRFETEDLPDTDNYQGNAVVNYTAREVPYTRIIEHKHFLFGQGEGTVITREYPATYHAGDFEHAGAEKGTALPYYPVNDKRNDALYAQYAALAKEYPRILFGGRLGRYRYYNMDQVIRQALDDAAGSDR